MRGTWSTNPPPKPGWYIALGIALLILAVFVVLEQAQVIAFVNNLSTIAQPTSTPSPTPSHR
jgi:hypothetical protein